MQRCGMNPPRTVSLIALAIFSLGALPTVRAALESRLPQLLVPGENGDDAMRSLRVSGLEIDVEVVGHRATTTLTMTFRNDLDRVLEGELVFPLGEGETISRFAMSAETSTSCARAW